MKKLNSLWLAPITVLVASICVMSAQQVKHQSLHLLQTISIPNIKGRLDHMDVDVKGKRLFVAGLENGTFEVIDLQSGKWIRSIPGFKKPQGALYIPELNKLFLASGDDGMVRVFRGDTLALVDSIQLEPGPNRIVFEPHSKLVYVGYGGKDAGKDYGEIAIIGAANDRHIADIKTVAHPSELLFEQVRYDTLCPHFYCQ
jgi:DNA-binding beta-propeller fold protein YncE